MDKFTIYCNEEQSLKALMLGAPIREVGSVSDAKKCFQHSKNFRFYEVPTAEQMIGWLEENGITIEVVKCETHWFARAYSYENTNFNKGRFLSRREATIAAIDAAVDYLLK